MRDDVLPTPRPLWRGVGSVRFGAVPAVVAVGLLMLVDPSLQRANDRLAGWVVSN